MKILFDVTTYKKLCDEFNQRPRNDKEFYKNGKSDQLQFLYNMMGSQWCYNFKDLYLRFRTRYLNHSIESGDLVDMILSLEKKKSNYLNNIVNDFDALSNLWVNPELDQFVSILDEIDDFCNAFLDSEPEYNPITEEQFYDFIEDSFLQLEKSLECINN